MAGRKKIPQSIRDKLLVDAMHRCCTCPQHEDVTDLVRTGRLGPDTGLVAGDLVDRIPEALMSIGAAAEDQE